MAESISFDTGLKEFDLNGGVTVRFNPTSVRFAERTYDAFDRIDKCYESYQGKISGVDDAKAFDIARDCESEILSILNELFGTDLSGLFEEIGPIDIANGLPVWLNLMLAVIDTLDSAFAEEKKKTNPRIKKYTEKYRRK